jgi:hypothetical protein
MRRALLVLLTALAVAGLSAPAAQGAFGLHSYDVTFEEADGTPAQAGTHPFAITTSFAANLDGTGTPEGWFRDVFLKQAPGLLGDATAYPRCTAAQFLDVKDLLPSCPIETAVGVTAISAGEVGSWYMAPVFNVAPPPGVALRLGFTVANAAIVIDLGLEQTPPYNAIAASRNTSQILEFLAAKTELWGEPTDPRHDTLRGPCGSDEGIPLPGSDPAEFDFDAESSGKECPVGENPRPLLDMPTYCGSPLASSYEAISWEGAKDSDSILTHDAGANPVPLAGCELLPALDASVAAQPTSRATHSPTGLDLAIGVQDEGLTSLGGRSKSRIKEVRITLPEGMAANPSLAEGLEVCSEDQLKGETLRSEPGEGCPQASKIGTVQVQTPLLEEPLKGALYQATPHANEAGDALIAFYIVVKNPKLGIIVKQPSRVEPDPKTGQLLGISENIPQTAAFSSFELHFREGGRSPLVSPPLCGTYQVKAQITPWSGAPTETTTSTFQIQSGPNEGPCPPGGTPPFAPGFKAGSENNAAGAFSPFLMHLTRRDGDQDLTRFDATLPPGVVAKLAGLSKCSDAQIARAKTKTGLQERATPSCPANSKIGTLETGAGVGSQLTYVPGRVYLAGPFGGSPISAVAIVPAVAGPFDVGTVVYRQALKIDPQTAVVSADGAKSDPLPHILAGIPVLVRDVQVAIDRPDFTLNPTSCDPFATRAQIWGGGRNVFSAADDSPVSRESRYQAASCQSLGFKPRLDLKLKGGTRRGSFPALRFLYRPRPGDANLSKLALRFPRSEFVEQGHFRTICTRVQFAAGAGHGANCPKGSVYGHIRVFSPLLGEPFEGPVFLRSSNHNLPDVVLALHGPPAFPLDVEVSSRIDSIHGQLRAIAQGTPDVPVSKVLLKMQGGQKGLFVNSTNLCAQRHRARVSLEGHNAKQATLQPELKVACRKHAGRRPTRSSR